MSFTINLDQNKYTFRADSKSKSTFNVPSFKEKDLNGCGTPEYFSFSHSLAVNYRNGCAKPVPALRISVKSLRLAGPSATTMSSYYRDAVESIASYVFQLSSTPLDVSQVNTSASNNAPFVSSIKEEVSDGTPTGFSKIIVSRPTTDLLYDVCQPSLIIGRSASVSVTEQVFDPTTCRTKLGQTVSISLAAYLTAVYSSTASAAIPWGVSSLTAAADAFTVQTEQEELVAATYDGSSAATQAQLLLTFGTQPAPNTNIQFGV